MQERNALVSIIVPVYNVEKYLEKCVKSIINQSYRNLEIILVDDGSADLSGELCDKLAEEDSRIHVIHRENVGVTSARRVGLQKAGGKYIGFVDSDDSIDEKMYEHLVENIEDTGADFVHSGYFIGQSREACFENAVIHFDTEKDKEDFLREYVLDYQSSKRMSASIWSKLFRAELIRESYDAVPDTQTVGEDWINLAECILRSRRISLLNAADYHYTVREGSLSHSKDYGSLTWQPGFYKALEDVLKRHGCYERQKKWLDNLFMNLIKGIVYEKFKDRFLMIRYRFKNIEMIFDKKIVLYGAGKVGRDYYAQLCRYSGCDIVAWADSNYQNISCEYAEIVGKEKLSLLEYDYLIIAVLSESSAGEIREMLLEEGVDPARILWEEPADAFRNEFK